MTEVSNQQQRGGLLAPVLGAGAAGVGGYLLADKANFGINTAGYTSWQDVIADTTKNDKFFKNLAEKASDADVKEAYTKVEQNLASYRGAETELTNIIKEGADRELLNAVSTAEDALAKAEENLTKKVTYIIKLSPLPQ